MTQSEPNNDNQAGQGWGSGGWGSPQSQPQFQPQVPAHSAVPAGLSINGRRIDLGLILLVAAAIYAVLVMLLKLFPIARISSGVSVLGGFASGSIDVKINGWGWGSSETGAAMLGESLASNNESGLISADSLVTGLVLLAVLVVGGFVAWKKSSFAGAIVLAAVGLVDFLSYVGVTTTGGYDSETGVTTTLTFVTYLLVLLAFAFLSLMSTGAVLAWRRRRS